MSLTFKLLSLAVRTAAKPLGNYIKRQAKEHEGFRRFAIRQAQRVHQLDMRMRLGIFHDAEAQQKMHEREAKAAEERKRKAEAPTVRTEEEQRKHDHQQAQAEKEGEKKGEDKPHKIKIRPLSDAKAIELGANFFSEAFIFAVAAGLIVLESWRSRRKESARRDDIRERLEGLEAEVERLRSKYEPQMEALTERAGHERSAPRAWWNPAGWWKTDAEPLPEDLDAVRDAQSRIPSSPHGGHGNELQQALLDIAKPAEGKSGAHTNPSDPKRSQKDHIAAGEAAQRLENATASSKQR